MFKNCLLLFILMLSSFVTFSKVELPHIFNNNMVLKQKTKANLWGKATPLSTVKIITSWNNKTYNTTAAQDGKWKVPVTTPSAGGPFAITFDDGEKTRLNNIMIGEVWVCSGQSNMAKALKGSADQPILNSAEIIAKSANNNLRLFTVKLELSKQVKEDVNGEWFISSPATTPDFSAVAFQFGQMLQQYLKVPVGLIVTSWGGTPIRSWMGDSFDGFAQMYPAEKGEATSKSAKVLYNAMIAPLIPYTISGFLWYQGEGDRMSPELYEKMMPAMVKEWRTKWGQGDLGFYYAEIAPWLYTGDRVENQAPYLREAQFKALQNMGNAAMAVTADIGSDKTIHPPDKTTVAERLLKCALVKTYGVKHIMYEGPVYKSMKIQRQKIILTFNNTGSGLIMKEQGSENFEVAGADKIFHKADAKITGKTIEVISSDVNAPVAVRYAFKNFMQGNLYNKEGLPAVPFRTDNWERKSK